MPFTADEFKEMTEYVRRYMVDRGSTHNTNYIEHLHEQGKKDLEFRCFIKNHYPEALAEWVALQKIGE
jgi:hypothetical protein